MKKEIIPRTLVRALALFCCAVMLLCAGALCAFADTDNSGDMNPDSTVESSTDRGENEYAGEDAGEDGKISDTSEDDDGMFEGENGVVSDSSDTVEESGSAAGTNPAVDGNGMQDTADDNADDTTAGTVTGIVIAIIVAVAIILLIIILIPKKRPPRAS